MSDYYDSMTRYIEFFRLASELEKNCKLIAILDNPITADREIWSRGVLKASLSVTDLAVCSAELKRAVKFKPGQILRGTCKSIDEDVLLEVSIASKHACLCTVDAPGGIREVRMHWMKVAQVSSDYVDDFELLGIIGDPAGFRGLIDCGRNWYGYCEKQKASIQRTISLINENSDHLSRYFLPELTEAADAIVIKNFSQAASSNCYHVHRL